MFRRQPAGTRGTLGPATPGRVSRQEGGGRLGRFFDLADADAAADTDGDPNDIDFDIDTVVGPLRFPCVICRRGLIAVFEPGACASGRAATCPACAGTGLVNVARSRPVRST